MKVLAVKIEKIVSAKATQNVLNSKHQGHLSIIKRLKTVGLILEDIKMKTMTLSYFGRYENENNDLKLRQLKKKISYSVS